MKEHKPHVVADAILPRGQLRVERNSVPHTMLDEVTATLSNQLATHMYEYIVDVMAGNCDMSRREFMEFLHFLTHDPGTKDRFVRYRTARRLMGD